MNETAYHSNPSATPDPTGVPTGHSLRADERREILVRGVREVLSFDENNVRLVTTAGILNVEGRELRIPNLNTKEGVVAITGILDGVLYENENTEVSPLPTRKGLFWRRG